MRIIKVDAIDSTNTFLRDENRKNPIDSLVCVLADVQTAGKGQMGTSWQSEAGKNLTFSVFLPIHHVKIQDQFYISKMVSLCVFEALSSLLIPKLSIKWPNDILADKFKLCGILIENVITNGSLSGAIVGIGLNVNQTLFNDLPNATSLKILTGKNYHLDEVLLIILRQLELRLPSLKFRFYKQIDLDYHKVLFRIEKPSTFRNVKGEIFIGIIKGTLPNGKLSVLLEDEIIKNFDLKEIQLLY